MSSTRISDAVAGAQPREWPQTLLAVALCLPGALLIVATAAMLVALPFGVDPLWRVEPLTLPEAAALRDNGEAVRLIWLGADPNAAGPVREGIVHRDAQALTPLEAAAAARRADMIELLLEQGAVMDGAVWTRLMCIATDVDSNEVREFLERRRFTDAPGTCEGIKTPWSDLKP